MITGNRIPARLLALGCCLALTTTGCAFQGLNSLALPGAVGRGSGSHTYRVEIANVNTLEPNSPVMINDVVVGSVSKMTFADWHADVDISVRPDVVVPANVIARVGQTSLLGSMHLALDPPDGQAPTGQLAPGSTIGLNQSATYPSTEQTLSSLSAVVNGGGLGQIGDIIHNFNATLSGRQNDIRELLTRLRNFVGTFDEQRGQIIASINALARLSDTFASQRDAISAALVAIPPALKVLERERPRLTTALEKLGTLSTVATKLVTDTQADLVTNLQNLEPTFRALADVGPDLARTLAFAPLFPAGQDYVDRGIRGDYVNVFLQFDMTVPRLKRALMLGTRWGEKGATLVPAPGDPWYLNYTYNPLTFGVTPSPPVAQPNPPAEGPTAPLAPGPPLSANGSTPPEGPSPQIFAGPYPAVPSTNSPAPRGGR